MKTFRELIVWQKAHRLTLEVYRATRGFPREERYGLVSQVRRSAASTATNIVEGYKRASVKENLRFLNTADGSLEETKYHLLLSRDLGYIGDDDFKNFELLCDEVGRLLCGYQKALIAKAGKD
ncbi:MAG: four helix bundle protein [Candidatus Margulisbacteria bacterium]|jgi:four helix bundle protein|nr:four helix bundle protein [Candidatus Margulisiibacteriota bacterium]